MNAAPGSFELGPFPDDPGYRVAAELDATDDLAAFADEFVPTEPGLIYLDGNSLGRLPVATPGRIQEVVEEEWGRRLIRSWPEKWWGLADEIGGRIAPLIGARPEEVIVIDSTSVALLKLTLGALRVQSGRQVIVTDDLNFPTDNYVAAAAAELGGNHRVETVASSDGIHGPEAALAAALGPATALLTLSHVVFKSGFLYDMERLTRAAHDAGALVLWDLSHSVGAVPIDLGGSGADLAVGCTYKYLNGGPGSPAFIYVNRDRLPHLENPFTGWWGHREPFAFDLGYVPAASIRRFQTGTMPILSLTGVETGVALAAAAGLGAIRRKSIGLTEFFIAQSRRLLEPHGFRLASPPVAAQRGSHVSLRHRAAWQIVQAMIDLGRIIPDFRDPDNIRFGLAPLYTSYREVHTAVCRMARIMDGELYRDYPATRRVVT